MVTWPDIIAEAEHAARLADGPTKACRDSMRCLVRVYDMPLAWSPDTGGGATVTVREGDTDRLIAIDENGGVEPMDTYTHREASKVEGEHQP